MREGPPRAVPILSYALPARLLAAVALSGWLAAGLIGPAAARAQAPAITPAGDPSVRSDTIYALAAEARRPGERQVVLLDDGVIVFEADGRGTMTYREVFLLLDSGIADARSRTGLTVGFTSPRERARLNWARVLRPDGTVLNDRPHTATRANLLPPTAYPGRQQLTVRLDSMRAGAIVDWSYTVEVLEPLVPDAFYTAWFVNGGWRVRRSRLVVDLPESVAPRVLEHNLGFARREQVSGGRRVMYWTTAEVPPNVVEPFSPWPGTTAMVIRVAAPIGWGEVARQYARLSREGGEVTPPLDSALAARLSGASTRADSLNALVRWTALIRPVEIPLAAAGLEPRSAEATATGGEAIPRDQARLFVALARRIGYPAHPVLVGRNFTFEPAVPAAEQLDHVVVAVERSGGYDFLDPSRLLPAGVLDFGSQGRFGVLVRPDGAAEEITLPAEPPERARVQWDLTGVLSANDSLTARYTRTGSGALQAGLREDVLMARGDSERIASEYASELTDDAVGDSVEFFDARDLGTEPRVSVRVLAQLPAAEGRHRVLLPLRPLDTLDPVSALESIRRSGGPRRAPIDAARVVEPFTQRVELNVRLPLRARALLPPGVSVSGPFGSYTATYTQQGRRLHVVRQLTGRRGLVPPDQLPALLTLLRAMASDTATSIVVSLP